MRALLFLDVDGTLLPFGAAGPYPSYEPAFPPPDAVTGRPLPAAGIVTGHPLLTRVNPALGARLTSLGLCAGRGPDLVDDEITDADRAWVAVRHPGRALLHGVDPQVELADGDFAVLEEWLASEGR